MIENNWLKHAHPEEDPPYMLFLYILTGIVYVLCAGLLLYAAFYLLTTHAFAGTTQPKKSSIPDDVAVHCILGEVRGQYDKYGYNAFHFQAAALRNRNHTRGVYGCNVNFSDEDTRYMKARGIDKAAARAWAESAYNDPTDGADHWASITVDQTWLAEMNRDGYIPKVTFGDHAYFKHP